MDKNALFKIGYGLYVVTAKEGDKDNGCIGNAIMQVTSNPIQIAIALNKSNYTTGMIERTKYLNISVLNEEAKFEAFQRFGYQSGKNVNKFDNYNNCKRSQNGIYYITENTNAYISVHTVQMLDLGTHILFLGDMEDGEVFNNEKTATYDFYQNNIKPKPEKTTKNGWRCKICGYILEEENLPNDFICPICKHGASDFEKI